MEQIVPWLKNIELTLLKKYQFAKIKRIFLMLQILQKQMNITDLQPFQKPYSFYIPQLPTQPIFSPTKFKWVEFLEQNFNIIRDEMLSINSTSFEEYLGEDSKAVATEKKEDWNIYYFYRNFQTIEENVKKCPKTIQILNSLPERLFFGMVCFSSLKPGGKILPHTGPSNMRLTCHLGLSGCDGNIVRVGNEITEYKNGKCVIFDDSFIHEVSHKGNEKRVTLMFDFWHPNLIDDEVSAIQEILSNAKKDFPNNFEEFCHLMTH